VLLLGGDVEELMEGAEFVEVAELARVTELAETTDLVVVMAAVTSRLM
jgi:hypothetical protein